MVTAPSARSEAHDGGKQVASSSPFDASPYTARSVLAGQGPRGASDGSGRNDVDGDSDMRVCVAVGDPVGTGERDGVPDFDVDGDTDAAGVRALDGDCVFTSPDLATPRQTETTKRNVHRMATPMVFAAIGVNSRQPPTSNWH